MFMALVWVLIITKKSAKHNSHTLSILVFLNFQANIRSIIRSNYISNVNHYSMDVHEPQANGLPFLWNIGSGRYVYITCYTGMGISLLLKDFRRFLTIFTEFQCSHEMTIFNNLQMKCCKFPKKYLSFGLQKCQYSLKTKYKKILFPNEICELQYVDASRK